MTQRIDWIFKKNIVNSGIDLTGDCYLLLLLIPQRSLHGWMSTWTWSYQMAWGHGLRWKLESWRIAWTGHLHLNLDIEVWMNSFGWLWTPMFFLSRKIYGFETEAVKYLKKLGSFYEKKVDNTGDTLGGRRWIKVGSVSDLSFGFYVGEFTPRKE